jgi:hypothetical protein
LTNTTLCDILLLMEDTPATPYDPTESFGNHLIEAAKEDGRQGLREAELQYGRIILAAAEEAGGVPERDQQFNTIRRGRVWLATSILSLEKTYPGIAASISERYQAQKDAEQ